MSSLNMIKNLLFILCFSLLCFFLILKFGSFGQDIENNSILGRLSALFFPEGTVQIQAGKNINLQELSIWFKSESVKKWRILYKNGKQVSRIPNSYGFNMLDVFYKGKFLGRANIYKTNWYHSDYFDFIIQNSNGDINVKFKVHGPDGPGNFVSAKEFSGDKPTKEHIVD